MQMLGSFVLSQWKGYLKQFSLGPCNKSMYLLSKIEPLQNVHLEVLKVLKECTISYLSSKILNT